MQTIDFNEANTIYTRPQGMTPEECGDLAAYSGNGEIISCWKLSDQDMRTIQETGVIWLHISGTIQPPVYIGTEDPFTTDPAGMPPD